MAQKTAENQHDVNELLEVKAAANKFSAQKKRVVKGSASQTLKEKAAQLKTFELIEAGLQRNIEVEKVNCEADKVNFTMANRYLRSIIKKMKSQACRDKLKDPSVARPSQALVKLQTSKWADFGVSCEAGDKALQSKFEGVELKELEKLQVKVMETAGATLMQALQDRRPEKLTTEGTLSKDLLMEFFTVAIYRMGLEETGERLHKYCVENGDFQGFVEQFQSECFELLGVEAKHAQSMFKKLGRTFGKDHELLSAYDGWRKITHITCMQSLQRACMEANVEPVRDFRITTQLLEKYGGFWPGCQGCECKAAGLAHRNHSIECRRRLQEKMQESKEGRATLEEAKCNDQTRIQLLEFSAKVLVAHMEPDKKRALAHQNVQKVKIIRALPSEASKQHLNKMSFKDHVEFVASEILCVEEARRVISDTVTDGAKKQAEEAQAKAEEEQAKAAAKKKAEEEARGGLVDAPFCSPRAPRSELRFAKEAPEAPQRHEP